MKHDKIIEILRKRELLFTGDLTLVVFYGISNLISSNKSVEFSMGESTSYKISSEILESEIRYCF